MRKITLFLFLLVGLNTLAQSNLQTGEASFYADKFQGRLTASGEIFSQAKMTAAHRTLPFGTKVRVTNLNNYKSIVVRINDRGPFVKGRIIDLTKTAAKRLGFLSLGVTQVKLEIVNGNSEVIKDAKVNEDHMAMAVERIKPIFYAVDVTKIQPKGYAVQVGSFRTAANMIKLTNYLKEKHRKRVSLKVHNDAASILYTVLVGPFIQKKQAEFFRNKISMKFPNSFVISFSDSLEMKF